MTMHRATRVDLPEITAFLRAREGGSMFLLSNLHGGRICWPGEPEPGDMHDTTLWITRDAGRVSGVLGLSKSAILLMQVPDGIGRGGAAALKGVPVATLIGPDGQVPLMLDALGLSHIPQRHRDEEPGFTLALAELVVPDGQGTHARPLLDGDAPLLADWRAAYLTEVFQTPPDAARPLAVADVARWTALGTHRLLIRDEAPVALSGFNASLPQAVQIGAVYTPPPLRGQGLARRLVALHLAEARGAGVTRAHLFAASDPAARAYAAIGFRRAGTMGILQFHRPETVAG